MKKTPWLLFALLVEVLLVSVLAQAFDITTYTDGTSTGNFTFITGTESPTKTLIVPEKAYNLNAYLYLKGYLKYNLYQNLQGRNVTTYAGFRIDLISSFDHNDSCNDKDFTTYCHNTNPSFPAGLYQSNYLINFTVLLKTVSANFTYLYLTDYNCAEGDFGCGGYSGTTFSYCHNKSKPWNSADSWLFIGSLGSSTLALMQKFYYNVLSWCINDSSDTIDFLFYSGAPNRETRIYDIYINYSLQSEYPTNVTLNLNNLTTIFNYGNANGSNLNHTILANISTGLSSSSVSVKNISFLSNTSGILEYSGVYVRYNNILNLSIYDELTGALIAQNITIEVYKGTSISYYWTTNGTIAIIGNFDGDYSVAAYNNNYSKRYNTVSFTGGEYRNLSIYLANTSGTVTFTIQDQYTGEVIENAIMSMYRIIGTSWQLVESKFTDVTGKATFGYAPNIRYRFDVTADEYENKTFYLDPIIYASYSVNMIKTSDAYYALDYEDASLSFYPTEFKNNQKNIIYINVSSATGTLQSYTLFLQYPGGSNYTFGWVPIGENFVIDFNITNAGIFDRANLTFSYTVNGILRTFVYQLPINEEYAYTLMSNRTNPLGISWFERILLSTFALIIIAGFSMAAAGTLAGGAVTIFIGGILVYIHWLPYWVFVPLGLVGGLMIYSGAQS